MRPRILPFFQILFSFAFLSSLSFGQSLSSSQLYHQLLKLRETKRVLYVAAHPDDENTRMIAYLANGEHAEAMVDKTSSVRNWELSWGKYELRN